MEKPKFASVNHEGNTYIVPLNPKGGLHCFLGVKSDFNEMFKELNRGEQPKRTIPPSRKSKREIYRTVK